MISKSCFIRNFLKLNGQPNLPCISSLHTTYYCLGRPLKYKWKPCKKMLDGFFTFFCVAYRQLVSLNKTGLCISNLRMFDMFLLTKFNYGFV